MIKIDQDEIYNMLYEGWECLKDDLQEDVFDYEFFKIMATHTFAYLYPCRMEKRIPREMLSILFRINAFAEYPVGISREFEAAQMVAKEFCNQMEECWVQIDGAFDENRFAVLGHCGEEYIIDANTFDLGEIV